MIRWVTTAFLIAGCSYTGVAQTLIRKLNGLTLVYWSCLSQGLERMPHTCMWSVCPLSLLIRVCLSQGLERMPHTYVECVPLPRVKAANAPMYFKKAINECENEFESQNKALIDTVSVRERAGGEGERGGAREGG